MPKLTKSAPKKKKTARIASEMKKFGEGALHSGSKKGPIVKDAAQAKAIALSEAGMAGKSASKKSVELANRRPRNRGRS